MGSYDKCSIGIYYSIYKIQILCLKEFLDLAQYTWKFSYLVFVCFQEKIRRKVRLLWSLSPLRVFGSPRWASINPLFIQHYLGHKPGYNAKTPDRIEKTWFIILALHLLAV